MNSLGIRLVFIVAVVLAFPMLLSGLWIDAQLKQTIHSQEEEQIRTQTTTLLASLRTLMLHGNAVYVKEWIDLMRDDERIIDIEILRNDGRQAFTDLDTIKEVNSRLSDARFSRVAVESHEPVFDYKEILEQVSAGETVIDLNEFGQRVVWTPIPSGEECAVCHGESPGALQGILMLAMASDSEMMIRDMRLRLSLILLAMMILLGGCLWLALQYGVVRPVTQLRNVLTRVGRGDRNATLPVVRVDELGEVAAEFNRMQQELVRKEDRIRGIMDSVADSIVVTDEQGIIESTNLVVHKMFGYQASELIGKSINVLVPELYARSHDHHIAKYLVNRKAPMVGGERELVGRRKDASTFPVEIFLNEINLDHSRHFVATLCDITERKNQTAILEYQALHDGLTGLANRVLFGDYLYKSISDARRDGSQLALLLMDLDRFKEINDTLGHQIGDILLKKVAGLLQKTLGEADMISRLGGDEFAILLHGVDRDAAIKVALKLYEVLDLPFVIDEQEGLALHVGVSIGITLYPEHGDENAANLLRRAEVAMYCAKRSKTNYAVYDPAEDAHSLQNLALFGQLRHAVRNDQLQLYYQPKINAKNGKVAKLEVLLRWLHPKKGLISPDNFIPLAERTGLIDEITLWVVKEALKQCRKWRRQGFDLSIAVNISAVNLQEAGFANTIKGLMDRECRERQLLCFEITETSIMLEPESALKTLSSFSDMGIRLSIDDFGTGYSSLAYLKQLPVNELKIDKSFILGMEDDDDDAVLVRSTVDLAHNMGLSVVAEGVENKTTCKLLTAFGCEELQGNYLCPALPAEVLERWFMDNPSILQRL